MNLDDTLWEVLDTIHLGDFFDKKNIPPIVFPILLILLVAGIYFMFFGNGASNEELSCGDGFCNPVIGETLENCPLDCKDISPEKPEGKKIIISFGQKPDCTLLIKLMDASGIVLQQKFGELKEFKFGDVNNAVVYVLIKGPQGQEQETDLITVTGGEQMIPVELANNICEGNGGNTQTSKLDLSIINSITGEYENNVKVSISKAGSASFIVKDELVNGRKTFDLKTGDKYVIYAEKSGFSDYDGSSNKIVISEGTNSVIIKLDPKGTTCNVGSSCTTSEDCLGTYDSACKCIDIADDNCPSTCPPGGNCSLGNGCAGTYDSNCNCVDVPGDNCAAECTVGDLCIDAYTNCPGEYDASCNCIDLADDGCPENCIDSGECIQGNGCRGVYDTSCNCIDVADDGCPFITNTEIGDLKVCLLNGTKLLDSGIVQVESLTGDLIGVTNIGEEEDGCALFKGLQSGTKVKIIAPNLPGTCVSPTPITREIGGGDTTEVQMDISCPVTDNIGYLRVKVLGWGQEVITGKVGILVKNDDETIIPGSGAMGTLLTLDGGYTEKVKVNYGDDVFVYIDAKNETYLDYTSEKFFLDGGEHKDLEITLQQSTPSSPLFSNDLEFVGVTTPDKVMAKKEFDINVGSITYKGIEVDPDQTELDASFADLPCRVSYDTSWKVSCRAPMRHGEYNAMLNISYNNRFKNESFPITVNEYSEESDRISIVPMPPFSGGAPLDMSYKIRFDDAIPDAGLVKKYVVKNLTFLDSPNANAGEIKDLEYVSEIGVFEFTADALFKGDYQAKIYIEIFKDGTIYNKTVITTFTLDSNSNRLSISVYPSDVIPSPGEDVSLSVDLLASGKAVQGLDDVFSVIIEGEGTVLSWDSSTYKGVVTMPDFERCGLPLRFMINGGRVDSNGDFPKLYVIDVQPRSTCPIDGGRLSCSNPTHMRACVNDYRRDNAGDNFLYEPEELLSCIRSSCSDALGVSCEEGNKGDMTRDCIISRDDVNIANEILDLIKRSPSEAGNYLSCLDMDNDLDVDESDINCLNKIQSGLWEGDKGGGVVDSTGQCPRNMYGGFCFDLDDVSILPGDFTGDGKVNEKDEKIFNEIINALDSGVTASEKIKQYADFDSTGVINNVDKNCFSEFKASGMDLDEGVILRANPLDDKCFNLLHLECGNKGDVNDDGKIDEKDWAIIFMMAKGLISDDLINTVSECADINHLDDNPIRVDSYDLRCIQSFVQNQETYRWAVCQDCDEYLPKYLPGYKADYEICNDGEDNNCDGLIDDEDPRCACGPTTPYTWVRDDDGGVGPGVEGDSDYKICRRLDWADNPDFEWISKNEVEGYCNKETHWARQMTSADLLGNEIHFTCVFDYPEGFKFPDNPLAGDADQTKLFNWLQGEGNIGPLGGLSRCGGQDTPKNWVGVRYKGGGCCAHNWIGSCTSHDKSYLYRFKYDFCGTDIFCVPPVGEYSGPPLCGNYQYLGVSTHLYNNDLYNEACEKNLECMGVYSLGHMAPNDDYCKEVAIECEGNEACCWSKGCANVGGCPEKTTCKKDDY